MTDSEFLHHTSCEQCGSSDANAVYSNATTYCFACQAWGRTEVEEESEPETPQFQAIEAPADLNAVIAGTVSYGLPDRNIKKAALEHFGVLVKKDNSGVTHHFYPYTKDGKVVAYKERVVEGKQFKAHGEMKGAELFGQSAFNPGGRKLIITEGEIDALAVAQAHIDRYNSAYPVVSLPNGVSSKKAVIQNIDYIRSFNEVVLMFDQDDPGRKAVDEVAKIIGADKVRVAKLRYKDPSDSYSACGHDEIINQAFGAQPWCPAGIVSIKDTWEAYEGDREAVYVPYPPFVNELNDKIYGRRYGSITMFTSGTGSGKTSFLREDMYHLWKTMPEARIGICSLEESISETVRGLMSVHISKRLGLPTTESTLEEERNAWEDIAEGERFELLDHQGALSDTSLLDKLRYLASTCDFIYLDHITIAVSESEGDMNKAIDSFMNSLLQICKQYNVWFGVVSHLRKTSTGQDSFEAGGDISEDDLKGSGSLKQIAMQTIALMRNKHADNPVERHTVKVKVLKDRFGGDTGYAGGYRFDMKTGRLKHSKEPEVPFSAFDES